MQLYLLLPIGIGDGFHVGSPSCLDPDLRRSSAGGNHRRAVRGIAAAVDPGADEGGPVEQCGIVEGHRQAGRFEGVAGPVGGRRETRSFHLARSEQLPEAQCETDVGGGQGQERAAGRRGARRAIVGRRLQTNLEDVGALRRPSDERAGSRIADGLVQQRRDQRLSSRPSIRCHLLRRQLQLLRRDHQRRLTAGSRVNQKVPTKLVAQ